MAISDYTNKLDQKVETNTQILGPKVVESTIASRTKVVENTVVASGTREHTNEHLLREHAIELLGAALMALDPNRLVATNANKELVSVLDLTNWVVGSVDNGDGTVTLPSESDPVFVASPAAEIASVDISNWNAAYAVMHNAATVGGYPLSISGQEISFSYNTTNLKLTSNQLDTIQNINTEASPTFVSGIFTGYLDVSQGILAVGSTTGFTIPSGAGTRLMWIPAKVAFRAGKVVALPTVWDEANIGVGSFASGEDNIASGSYSTASGRYCTASGSHSTASGYGATASGSYSTASGYAPTASGSYSTASGLGSTASGSCSVALGSYIVASGYGSFAIGSRDLLGAFRAGTGTVNEGQGQIAIGYASQFNTLKAEGTGSIAMGQDVNALTNDNVIVIGKSFSTDVADSFNVGFGQVDFRVRSGEITLSNLTGLLKGTSGVVSAITDNSANWNVAYGWGDHAGLYDVTGTAYGLVGAHESTYNHSNYNTAYGWGDWHHTTLAGYGITDAQSLDTTLTALAELDASTGFLKQTGADTFAKDAFGTASYIPYSSGTGFSYSANLIFVDNATPALSKMTAAGEIQAEQLTSTDDLTMAGYLLNTMAADDTLGINIDGNTYPFIYSSGNPSAPFNFSRTYGGSGANLPTAANLGSAFNVTWDYDYTATSGKSIIVFGGAANFNITGDMTMLAGLSGGVGHNFLGADSAVDWKDTSTITSSKNTTMFVYGTRYINRHAPAYNISANTFSMTNYAASFQSYLAGNTITISGGTLTQNVIGGNFLADILGVLTINQTGGTLNFNYYGVKAVGDGSANGNSTSYGGYFAGTGSNVNYDVYANTAGSFNVLTGNTSIGYKSITGISKANPCVVTCVGHGLVDGQRIRISGVGGMTQVNDLTFSVGTILTADTFELRNNADTTDIDSSAYSTYTSGGIITKGALVALDVIGSAIISSQLTTAIMFIISMKSGATQEAAGAAANELWKTNGHATLPNDVVMIGV